MAERQYPSTTGTPLSEYLAYWRRRPSFLFHMLLFFGVATLAARQWISAEAAPLLIFMIAVAAFFGLSFLVFRGALLRLRAEEEHWYRERDLPAPLPIWRSADSDRYFSAERDAISDRFFGNTILNTTTAFGLNALIIIGLATIHRPYSGELWLAIGMIVLCYVFAYGIVLGPKAATRDCLRQRLAEIERDLAAGRLTIAPG